ncbi:hypothetical protein Tco_1300495 [Tanacetum coccineum]
MRVKVVVIRSMFYGSTIDEDEDSTSLVYSERERSPPEIRIEQGGSSSKKLKSNESYLRYGEPPTSKPPRAPSLIGFPKAYKPTRTSHVYQMKKTEEAKEAPRLYDRLYSKSAKDHETRLYQVLSMLKQEKLYAKLSKCELWLREVQFLGHVINNEGIKVDPAKIIAIMNWEQPKTPIEIRTFLGLASDPNSSNANGFKDSTTTSHNQTATNLSSALVEYPLLESIAAKKSRPLTTSTSFNASTIENSVPPGYLKFISNLENEVMNVSMKKEQLKIEVMRAQVMINILQCRVDKLIEENNGLRRCT